jgi:hypothetical protein
VVNKLPHSRRTCLIILHKFQTQTNPACVDPESTEAFCDMLLSYTSIRFLSQSTTGSRMYWECQNTCRTYWECQKFKITDLAVNYSRGTHCTMPTNSICSVRIPHCMTNGQTNWIHSTTVSKPVIPQTLQTTKLSTHGITLQFPNTPRFVTQRRKIPWCRSRFLGTVTISWVKWSLPLVVVRLDEVKIRVPLVTYHLRRNKSEEKQKIRHYWGVLNPSRTEHGIPGP